MENGETKRMLNNLGVKSMCSNISSTFLQTKKENELDEDSCSLYFHIGYQQPVNNRKAYIFQISFSKWKVEGTENEKALTSGSKERRIKQS